jgi:2'-5' RNA ligase
MIRAFLALPIPDPARAMLAALLLRLPLRPVATENLHLTLVFLDRQPEDRLSEFHEALEGLRPPRLTLAFDRIDVFGVDPIRQVHLRTRPNPALDQLHKRLQRIARSIGIDVPARRFVPHVTLGRPDTPPDPRLGGLIAALAPDPTPFEVTEMVLYRSTLRPQGPLYDALARYPLA